MEKSKYSGRGSSEYPCRTDKVAQGSLTHTRHFFREKNPIIPDIDSKYIIHSSKSYRKLHSDRNIQIFKEVYQYCLHRGFSITTVHADGEF